MDATIASEKVRGIAFSQGDRIGRLTFESLVVRRDSGGRSRRYCSCRCDCGSTKEIAYESLARGLTKSCGCVHREQVEKMGRANRKHGGWKTKVYKAWQSMRERCNDPRSRSYASYGARGISVCDEWNESFEKFREWSESHGLLGHLSIDRIDNDGPYSPENCRWTDQKTQARNRRSSKSVTAFGEPKTLAEWSDDPRCVVSYAAIRSRIASGWDPETALTTPARVTRSSGIPDEAGGEVDA